jgi:ribosomal protein L11 methyltransferase
MKKQKSLWRVSVATSPEAEDAVGELLASVFNAAATIYFDLEKQTSLVSVFVEQGKISPAAARQEISAGLKRIAGFGLKTGAGKIEIAKVKREDWAESWKKHFQPLEIIFRRDEFHESQKKEAQFKLGTRGARPTDRCGKSLLVKPSWSKQRPRKNQAVVILDPGLSFGTGQHPTTSFCLNQIVGRVGAACQTSSRRRDAAKSFLDMGTGSGILAIAAAKLGCKPVHAFDFDPESVRVAKENVRKNKVQTQVKPVRGDVTKLPLRPARQYDLICANLISNLLLAARRRLVNRLKHGGTLVLAGILAAEFGEVQRAFEDLGLKLAARRVENEWCSGAFCFM